ncbi:MAG: type II toxin-antitoxin system PemK/MazF family toxin [Bacteroidales bacterium]|nr:type II toxin-antitoxin system PemK/MazF family toxin [Bacteroidales bacterium]
MWLINLDPTIGAEIKKTRPAIIVNDDSLGKLPLKIIVPLTDWNQRYEVAPWMVKIEANSRNGLTKNSSADCFQIRSISEKRFVKRLGNITKSELDEIRIGLSKVLSIENE